MDDIEGARLATDISDLGELEVAERVPACDEVGKVAEGGGDVDRNASVPVGAVGRAPVGSVWGRRHTAWNSAVPLSRSSSRCLRSSPPP